MDETSVSGAKRFKVLRMRGAKGQGTLPLMVEESKLPHLTGGITVSAAGKLFNPMIILPKLKHLKSLEEFVPTVSFASSVSGWMNRDLFQVWTLDILEQISRYRITELPESLQDQWIVLIIDGHVSRLDFESNLLFHSAKVCMIVLPGHTTHVLQPIDVGLTSPIKTNFKYKLADLTRGDIVLDESGHDMRLSPAMRKKMTADRLRYVLVSAFLHGVQSACTYVNIKSAWEKSGLSPICPARPLASGFVVPKQQNEDTDRLLAKSGIDRSEVHSVANVNHGILSDGDGLRALVRHQYRRDATLEDFTLTPDRLSELATRHAVGARKENISLSHTHTMILHDGFLEVRRNR
jgi:hypothetical protein